ncbi:MAG TPA: hypothetical protein VF800_22850 [Telluria sp.]|jgi:hypothetical protein
MDTMNAPAEASLRAKLLAFSQRLSPGERDCLKFRLSLASTARLDRDFDISGDPQRRLEFFDLLRYTLAIQPFHRRVPKYGIAYLGRPQFMTDELVQGLRDEARQFRCYARENYDQFIATIDTPAEDALCERLASSEQMLRLVTRHAGACVPSYITSYIYYDAPGHCSKPHVDNAFTSLTVMIGLRHDHDDAATPGSASIVYWQDSAPMAYRLAPGELAVFFGSSVLHGRSPVGPHETVHSLLLSFRPVLADQGESV